MQDLPEFVPAYRLFVLGVVVQPTHPGKVGGVQVGHLADVVGGEAQMGFAQTNEGFVKDVRKPCRVPQVMERDVSHGLKMFKSADFSEAKKNVFSIIRQCAEKIFSIYVFLSSDRVVFLIVTKLLCKTNAFFFAFNILIYS